MLTIAALGSGQARYYLSLTAASYYTDAPEPVGLWYGLGAKEFGLEGTVRAEDLTQLCKGYDPRDPSRHVRNAERDDETANEKKNHVPRKHGDDLCFSAPKSVSVAWALASPELREAIEAKMQRAVRDALDYIQDECGLARVGAQGQRIENVPLLFALFEHSSSRLGDPQLHIHAVCSNLTSRTDDQGRIRVTAIDSTHFYHHMMAAGALFRASLAQGMRELGFEVERDGFAFRLKGISEDLCERFSQRRAEIVDGILKAAKVVGNLSNLDAREVLQAARGRMAEIINLETRRGKKEYTRTELFGVWRDIAHSLGISEHHVQTLINAPRLLTPDQKRDVKEGLFREGLKKLTEEVSHFGAKELTRKLAEEAQGKGINAREVRELVENQLASGELVQLGKLVTEHKNDQRKSWRERTEERFTTREVIEMENRMIAAVERMTKVSVPVKESTVEAAIERTRRKLAEEGKKFSTEQADAVRYLTREQPGLIQCMTGKAGTGKSTTLDACRFAWELAGLKVIGCAIAGVAADELRSSAGIKSDTLARTLVLLENDRLKLTKGHVVVLDEAGMVPTKLMAKLIDQVEKAGAKLILVGDAAQLQAIGAGGPFRSITTRLGEMLGGLGQCVLTKIIRQREEWRRETVDQLSRGEAREALTAYAAKGQLHVTKTRDEAIQGVVGRWKADHGIENPKDCLLLASLNVEVHAINRKCQEERHAAGKLGEAKLHIGSHFIHEGDRVSLGKRSLPLGLENGFTAEVVSVDEAKNRLTVRLDNDDREVTISVKDYGAKNLKLGYASTVHKAQGKTVEHCHVLMGGHMTDRHLGYVQASRSRESTHLFIDQAGAGPKLRDAIRALSRDRSKGLARDILDEGRKAQELGQELARQQAEQAQRRRPLGIVRGF